MMSTSDEMIGSTAVWASGYTGAGRKIAIIDTGIDVDHRLWTRMPWLTPWRGAMLP